jgi:Rieske Fe-S protein
MKEAGFGCPCHGSKFDQEGRLVRGPAQKGMQTLRLEEDET